MRLLNPGYESESINNSLYWNRGSGTCYNSISNATTTCDFSDSGLTEEAKNMIDDAKWYTHPSTYNGTAQESYIQERKNVITYDSTDGIIRTQNWIGKVGLIYKSDYGYASSGCGTGTLSVCGAYDRILCTSTNWLYNGKSSLLLSITEDISNLLFIQEDGSGTSTYVAYVNNVFPVAYLISDVKIVDGDGTKENMYQLSL